MSSFTTISVEKLARLVGTPQAPTIVDLRTEPSRDGAPVAHTAALVSLLGQCLPPW